MKIGILGTGVVGRAIGDRLEELGHSVYAGSRGFFSDVAADSEVVFLCVAGENALPALELAGADALAGKVLVDVTNPMSWATGSFRLTTDQNSSLGEAIQAAYPATRVVKCFNTMNCEVMVDPGRLPGEHVVFVSGNEPAAKQTVTGLLVEIGWPSHRVIDLGDITGARAMEEYLHLWVRLMQMFGDADFNIAITRGVKA